jgi:outer membrane receptor protein involved in Fe transport
LNYGIGAAAKLGLPNVVTAGLPSTDVLPIWDLGNFQLGSSNSVPNYSTNNNFQYAGSVTYSRGAHTFKAGAGLIRRQLLDFNNQEGGGGFPTPNASINGLSNVAQFLLAYSQVAMRSVDLTEPHFFAWEPSFYGQDDWRVNSKLTLNLGLRYDIYTPWKEGHNQQSNFDLSTFTYILGKNDKSIGCNACEISPTLGVNTKYHDVSPRFGFAYSLDSKTVIRGGYGMSW